MHLYIKPYDYEKVIDFWPLWKYLARKRLTTRLPLTRRMNIRTRKTRGTSYSSLVIAS